MSLCVVITHQYSLATPGGGTMSCLQIARALGELGVEVILVPISRGPSMDSIDLPCRVVPVPPSRIHYLLEGLSTAKGIRRILANRKVDAVLSWDHEAAFLPRLLRSNRVLFGMIAGFPSYAIRENPAIMRQRVRRSLVDPWFRIRPLKRADVVFVGSNFTLKELTTLYGLEPGRIIVTYRGVDPIFARVKRTRPEKLSRFIFFGSLAPLKGVFDALRALGHLATQGWRDWTLKVASWDDERRVVQAAREHKIANQVVLLGHLDRPSLVRELKWAQLAILPSHAESFGRSIAEAQASGLPVVAYEAGSVPEVVEKDVTAWLVPLHNVDLLAEAIIEAMRDPKKAFEMGLAGRERVMHLFSWERTATIILKGIEEKKKEVHL